MFEKLAFRFMELLEESVIVQGTITVVLIGTDVYLVATGQEIPPLLADATMLVLGFYFGSKSQQQANTLVRRMKPEA